MNLIDRVKHIWALSAYEPDNEPYTHEPKPAGTHVAMIVKKPEKVTKVFLPRVTVTPAQEIIEQKNED